MDPLSAVGLAGSIVQFVSFAHEIVSLGKEVYKSPTGVRQESAEIGAMLKDLSQLHQSLRWEWGLDPGRRSQEEQTLFILVEQCEPIYKELQKVLQSLAVKGSHRKWKSFCLSVKLIWKEGKINDLERRLRRLQRQVDSRLVSDIRSKQAATIKLLQELAETSRRLEINRAVELNLVQREIEQGLEALEDPPQGIITKQPIMNILQQWIWGPHSVQGSMRLVSLSEHAHRARAYDIERTIIQELYFQEMNGRSSNIKDAHVETFQWIFSVPESKLSPVRFAHWLRQGDGIFWISGRPGSGKSTLMKYIYRQSRTAEILTQWAGDSKLIQACFYFWTAGSPLQKSIEGLLRSLVFQILRQCPSLIPAAFPTEWAELVGRNTFMTSFNREGLIQAIGTITEATNLNTKFCFFIDGLDEYEGFDGEIAATINTLASSPAVKICVASRPHNVFVNAFGGNSNQMLYVHEHTNSDIRRYVKDILERNPAFVSRTQQDPEEYQQLTEYIRKEANGVFLWVYLVVANMLDGMENADRMSDLQRKLKKVPTDLRALFAHILDTVEAGYHDQQAKMLLVACQTDQPLSLIGYSFLDEEDPDFALNCPVGPMAPEEVSRRYEYMERRVVARCKLLLEVVDRPSSENEKKKKYVIFLHRTVRDYLREAEVQELLACRLRGPFDPRRQLCDALLAEIKCAPAPQHSRHLEGVHNLVFQLLHVAKEVERLSSAPLISHLDSLRSTIDHMKGPKFDWWQGGGVHYPGDNLTRFLQLIIRSSLPVYLKWRLHDIKDYLHLSASNKADLLLSSLYTKGHELGLDSNSSMEIVEVLLRYGANPNYAKEHYNITPWTTFVLSVLRWFKHNSDSSIHRNTVDPALDRVLFLVFEQLILAGADLHILYQPLRPGVKLVGRPNQPFTIEQCIERTVTRDNATYLLNLIKKRRRHEAPHSKLYRWCARYRPPIAYDPTMPQKEISREGDDLNGNGIFDVLNRGLENLPMKDEKTGFMLSWQSFGFILFLLISNLLYARFA